MFVHRQPFVLFKQKYWYATLPLLCTLVEGLGLVLGFMKKYEENTSVVLLWSQGLKKVIRCIVSFEKFSWVNMGLGCVMCVHQNIYMFFFMFVHEIELQIFLF